MYDVCAEYYMGGPIKIFKVGIVMAIKKATKEIFFFLCGVKTEDLFFIILESFCFCFSGVKEILYSINFDHAMQHNSFSIALFIHSIIVKNWIKFFDSSSSFFILCVGIEKKIIIIFWDYLTSTTRSITWRCREKNIEAECPFDLIANY